MKISLLTAALLASGIAQAATPVDGWYTSIFGGYTYFPENVDVVSNGLLFNNAEYTQGYNAGGRFGYQSNPIRYELEYTYMSATAKNYTVDTIAQENITGFTSANLVMANLYFDGPEILPSTVPYLGVGIGYAYLQTSLSSTGPTTATYFSAKDNEFAYQGTAGLTYNFAENYALNLAYRYVATNRADNFGSVFQAHIANAGFVYHFDRGNYK